MPKDKAIAIATDKCSREKHSTQSTSPPWSNEKIAINKKQVSSQLLKCCKNTRHGAGGGTLRSNRPLLALRAARPDCFRSPAGQNAPQDRFVSPASSPVRLNQTQRHPTGASVFGAGGGTLRSNRPLLALRAARPDCFRSPAGQNAPQDRFVSRLRVPFDLTKHRGTQQVPLCLVPVVGLEPTRYCYQRILSPSRLPIPSHRRICSNFVHISV